MKRLFRLLVLAAIAGAVAAAVRGRQRTTDPLPRPAATPSAPWPPLKTEPPTTEPAPTPPAPDLEPEPVAAADPAPATPEPEAAGGDGWVEPGGDGECPDGYPIKAKLSSKIYHAPGQLNYERTSPDRCYASEAAAEADGLRAAKR